MTFEVITVVVYATLQILDVITTNKALEEGNFEVNPFMRWAQEKFGRWWVVIKVLFAGVGVILLVYSGHYQLIWLLNAFFAYVVWNNYKLYK